jgi:hypothetical protein
LSRVEVGEHLSALERSLENLLSCFESEPLPALEAMDSTWSHVLRAFQRLYAVATAVLARRREELAAQREACSEVRTRLRRARPDGASGGSCDVRG